MAEQYGGSERELECRCGERYRTATYPLVNVSKNPELREKVLDESLFVRTCPACGRAILLSGRCLYHDEDNGFLIYWIPGFRGPMPDEAAALDREYPEFAALTRRIVPTLNQLKEKLLILEAGIDDRAVELAKLAVSGLIVQKYGRRISSAYLHRLDEEADRIGFSFFLDGAAQPVSYQTHMGVYDRAHELAAGLPPADGFCCVDLRWAAGVLDRKNQ